MNGQALLVALLGASSMAVFALGLWLPAYLRHRAVQRRLAGFVNAGSASGYALDLAGRRRARTVRRQDSRERGQIAARYIARKIIASQTDVTVGEVAGAMAILGLFAFTIAAAWSGQMLVGALVAPVAAGLPILWLDRQFRRIDARFHAQLLDTVALLSSSVRSGHSLLQALEHVAGEAPEPTRTGFALVVREIGLGASQDDALERLADRFPSEDLELVVSAVNVHNQIGGSLSKVLDAIGDTIRERVRVAGDIRGLTSQQRYSAYVLSLLPVAAAAILMVVSPDYVAVLFAEGPLRQVLAVAAGLVVLGFFSMRWVARIDV
ncbi:MAG: type II secretion system F family protein [Candidatus Limnocylindria bacterium]